MRKFSDRPARLAGSFLRMRVAVVLAALVASLALGCGADSFDSSAGQRDTAGSASSRAAAGVRLRRPTRDRGGSGTRVRARRARACTPRRTAASVGIHRKELHPRGRRRRPSGRSPREELRPSGCRSDSGRGCCVRRRSWDNRGWPAVHDLPGVVLASPVVRASSRPGNASSTSARRRAFIREVPT